MARIGDGAAMPGRRLEVLRILKEARGPLTIHEIADRLGVHPNTVRFHLDTLVESGRVERAEVDRRTAGRPPLLFRPARGMDPAGPRRYRLLAEILLQGLADDPDRRARATESGRLWGYRMGRAAVQGDAAGPDGSVGDLPRLLDLLEEIGFAPEPREDAGPARIGGLPQIGLRHCPFLELAETGSETVCRVHLGLMRGALEAWDSPVTVDRLEPFVEPDLCLSHLTTRVTAGAGGDPG